MMNVTTVNHEYPVIAIINKKGRFKVVNVDKKQASFCRH